MSAEGRRDDFRIWLLLRCSPSTIGYLLLPKCPACLSVALASAGLTLSLTGPVLTWIRLFLLVVPAVFCAAAIYRRFRNARAAAPCHDCDT